MVSRVSMLVVTGLRMRMIVSMSVGVRVCMALAHTMRVRMTVLMLMLMRTFHSSSLLQVIGIQRTSHFALPCMLRITYKCISQHLPGKTRILVSPHSSRWDQTERSFECISAHRESLDEISDPPIRASD